MKGGSSTPPRSGRRDYLLVSDSYSIVSPWLHSLAKVAQNFHHDPAVYLVVLCDLVHQWKCSHRYTQCGCFRLTGPGPHHSPKTIGRPVAPRGLDRKSTRRNSRHSAISY